MESVRLEPTLRAEAAQRAAEEDVTVSEPIRRALRKNVRARRFLGDRTARLEDFMPMSRARRMWVGFESVHGPVYFVPQVAVAYRGLGLRGFWRGYYAGRAAPLGRVGAGAVIAMFYNFHPDHVRRALPEVWTYTTPDLVVQAREEGVTAALRVAWEGLDDVVTGAAPLVRAAAEAADLGGRPLGAANAELPWSADPVAQVWQGCTVLRESRGDGHVSSLVTSGLDPCACLVLKSALGVAREVLQPNRGWSDTEWEQAADRLRRRGLVGADGLATDAGRHLNEAVEARTDELADGPWTLLGEERTDRLRGLLERLARPARELVPAVTPIALPELPKG